MKRLSDVTVLVSPERASLPSRSNRHVGVPNAWDQEADIDIPRRVHGAWKPTGGVRELRRALTPEERAKVSARRQALADALQPYDPSERKEIEIAIAAMFGGFRLMRQQGENAEAVLNVTCHVLREFPAWAIAEGCLMIAQGRAVDEEGKPLDRRFPPNDAQIYAIVSEIVRVYRKNLARAEGLLTAPVAAPEPPRPTREQIEALLGRPLHDRPRAGLPAPIKDGPTGDGKHAQRVMADLEARRRRRAPESQASTIGERQHQGNMNNNGKDETDE
jgi:hypothetical protein